MPTPPSSADVIALTGTSLDSAVVDAIIADAVLLVEDNACFAGYSEAKQTAILKWLSAHLVASTSGDGVVTSEKLGDASQTYGRAPLGDGLKGTTYGQQVLALDTNGCLSGVGRGKASVQVLV